MIVATRDGFDRHIRTAEFGSSAVPPPGSSPGRISHAGVTVTSDEVLGLPVASAAIRLIAEVIASLPVAIYRGSRGAREWAGDAWQYKLLNDFGNLDQSPFELMTDLAAGPEAWGNSYAQKMKVQRGPRKGRVGELIPIDPEIVQVRRNPQTSEKEFLIWQDGQRRVYTTAEIFHVRGWTPRGGLVGVSPLTMHRHAFGNALAIAKYLGKVFANDASVPFALSVPGKLAKQEAQLMLEVWADTHGGLNNRGKPAIISNGATIDKIGMSLVDAAYVEVAKLSVQELATLYSIPASILGAAVERGSAMTAEQESIRLLRFGLLRRIKRLELAFRTDPDLFPPGRPEYPMFDTSELLRADTAGQATANHYYVQDGTLLRDEVRAELGRGPLPNGVGQIPLVTPVGAGANPDPLPVTPDDGDLGPDTQE